MPILYMFIPCMPIRSPAAQQSWLLIRMYGHASMGMHRTYAYAHLQLSRGC